MHYLKSPAVLIEIQTAGEKSGALIQHIIGINLRK